MPNHIGEHPCNIAGRARNRMVSRAQILCHLELIFALIEGLVIERHRKGVQRGADYVVSNCGNDRGIESPTEICRDWHVGPQPNASCIHQEVVQLASVLSLAPTSANAVVHSLWRELEMPVFVHSCPAVFDYERMP